MSLASLLAACVVLAAAEAAAQDRPSLVVGERVRVTTASGSIHSGSVTALPPGTVELLDDTGRGPVSVPWTSVTQLEVGRQGSRAVLGALVGTAVGALGAVALCAGEDSCVYTHLNGGRNDFSNELPFILGPVGGLVGFFVGRRMKTERWEMLPLDRVRLSMVPRAGGGLAFGLSMTF